MATSEIGVEQTMEERQQVEELLERPFASDAIELDRQLDELIALLEDPTRAERALARLRVFTAAELGPNPPTDFRFWQEWRRRRGFRASNGGEVEILEGGRFKATVIVAPPRHVDVVERDLTGS